MVDRAVDGYAGSLTREAAEVQTLDQLAGLLRTLRRRHVQKKHDVIDAVAFETLKSSDCANPIGVAGLTLRRMNQRAVGWHRMQAGSAQLIVSEAVEIRDRLLLQQTGVLHRCEQLLIVGDAFETLTIGV